VVQADSNTRVVVQALVVVAEYANNSVVELLAAVVLMKGNRTPPASSCMVKLMTNRATALFREFVSAIAIKSDRDGSKKRSADSSKIFSFFMTVCGVVGFGGLVRQALLLRKHDFERRHDPANSPNNMVP
jgi:hypothetical protein